MRDRQRGRLGRLDTALIADAAVAAFVVVLALAQQAASVGATAATRTEGLLFAALLPLVLVARRRAPVAVLAVALVAVALWASVGAATSGAGIPIMVALYTVGAHRSPRVALPAAAVTALWVLAVQAQSAAVTSNVVETVASCAAAWWLGATARTRRAQGEALAAYAAELAATREELAERRVAEERLRIAREMHDVVAHSLGVVAVQAGVAEHLLEDDPAQARRSVASIGEVARTGLVDMRRTLGLLRGGEEPDSRAAAPRLADVPALVEAIRAGSALDVRLDISGAPPQPLDPALELSVYRVVQEALTNVGKHAPGSYVRVQLAYSPGEVGVEIADDGSAAPLDLPGSGNGLVGMRERVGMFGGTFEATPRRGGGFRVAARFPLAGGTAA